MGVINKKILTILHSILVYIRRTGNKAILLVMVYVYFHISHPIIIIITIEIKKALPSQQLIKGIYSSYTLL